MSHPDDLLLLQYRFDTLEGDEKGRVADHLRTCSDCTIRYANLGKNVEKLGAWNAESELSESLVEQALERVRAKAAGEAPVQLPLGPAPIGPDAASQTVPDMAAPGAATTAAEPRPEPAVTRRVERIPLPEPTPEPTAEPFPGFSAWLGLKGGMPSSTWRFALTGLMAVTLLGLGGGQVYWGNREPKLQTSLKAPRTLVAGDRGLFSIDVTRADNAGAVAGADVEVVMLDGARRSAVFSGRTDGAGHLNASFDVPGDVPPGAAFEVVARALGETDTLRQTIDVRREVKLHLSTDKPLYQPGQTIHVRALALRAPSLTPLAGSKLTFDVLDPKGNRLGTKEVSLSRFGVGSFDFELADGIALGPYQVTARSGEDSANLKVEVSRYTLPKFSITLTPERDGYLAGEAMRVRLLARTFFGKPVGKAKVRALLVREGGAVAGEATTTTSGDGDAMLQLSLPASLGQPGAPEAVRVQVEVTDAAGEMEAKQLGTMVGRELLSVALVPAQGVLAPGVQNDVLVLLTTPDGKPVAGEGSVEMDGERILFKTAPNGVGSFTCTPRSGGAPSIAQVEVSDATGRRANLEVQVPRSAVAAYIEIERALVAPGEALTAKVRTLLAPGSLALELRRDGHLLDRQLLPTQPNNGVFPVKLQVPANVTGALDVQLVPARVAVQQYGADDRLAPPREGPPLPPEPARELKRRREMGPPAMVRPAASPPMVAPAVGFASRRILAADPRGVTVTMKTDQSPYRPGATAKVRFEVKDAAGKPTAAAIGVAVVDESLFALTTARPSLARAFFLLGSALQLSRGPLAAADLASSSEWAQSDQRAAQLLFAGASAVEPTAERMSESLQPKLAAVRQGKHRFEEVAQPGWLLWGAVLCFVLVVAISRYVSSWLGGVAIAALAVGVAELSRSHAWFLVLLALMALVAAVTVRVNTGRSPWGLLVVPGVVMLLLFFQSSVRYQYQPEPMMAERAPSAPVLAGKDVANRYAEGMAEKKAEPAMEARLEAMKAQDAMGPPAPAAAGALMKLGAGVGAAPEPAHREVRVRQYFPETLFVHPELVTDEQGIAQLEIPIADSITNWRVTALASTAGGKLGGAEEPLKVFQDFFVDLDLPVALVVGDTATIPISVHNYLGASQVVRLVVQPSDGFEVLGPKTFKLDVPAGDLVGEDLKIRVLTAGRHTLKVHADGTQLSDEISRELRVFDAGEERSMVVSGTLTPGKAIPVAITLPASAQPGSARLVARFYGSRVASAFSGLEGALAMPHGCFEQTSSTTYPNVLIWKHLLDTGKKDSPAIERARSYVALGYQRLLSYEVRGGGFEWFGRAPANQVLTAYGLLEFKDMAQVFPVDPAVIARTQDFLVARQQGDGSWEPDSANLSDGLYRSTFSAKLNVSAYIGWSLAESGYRGPALDRAARYLANNADQSNDPYTLALITGTLARAGHPQAQALAAKLEALAQKDGAQSSFTPSEATVYYSRGPGGSTEATALAVQALMAAKASPETVRGALTWLAANRDARGTWHSTQGTVMALRAILMGEAKESDQSVKVSVNGGAAISAQVTAKADRAATVDLAAKVKAGDNVVTLEGSAEAPFQVVLTWVQPWREAGADERDALSLGVSFGRTKAKVGDIVPVDLKVTYRKPEASGMVVAALGVPAGLAPLTEDLEALKARGRLARYEISGGVVNLYFDRLASGAPVALSLRFKAISRVTTKGQGSLAYLYYHPEVRAKAAATAMVVD